MCVVARFIIISGAIVFLAGPARGAQPSFEIDLKELDAGRKGGTKPAAKKILAPPKAKPTTKEGTVAAETAGEYVIYTVKPGDHIFKILLRDYHLSNAEAERLIPEIARINQVQDIRRLAVGQTLRLPKSLAAADRPPVKKRMLLKAEEPPAVAATVEAAPVAAPVAAPPAAEVPASPLVPVPAAVVPASAVTTEPPPQQGAEPAGDGSGVAAPAASPPAMAPVGSVLAVTVNGGDPLNVFLRLADVLKLQVQSQRVIESGAGTAERFSIKVPLYAEGQGKRLIIAGGGQDPFQYTLFRLLEAEGYGVLQFREADGFREVTAATLAKLGIVARLGRYRLINGKEQEVLGYLLRAEGGKMLLTDAPVGGVWSALEVEGEGE